VTASVFVGANLDGFIARANGDLAFLPAGGGEPHGYHEFMATVDASVIGRKTFETVLGFDAWPYGEKTVFVLSTRHSPDRGSTTAPAEIVSRLAARGIRHVYVDGESRFSDSFRLGSFNASLSRSVSPCVILRSLPIHMAEPVARALTIGHSNHPFERFLGLLRDQRVEIVADTRSQPYSKYASQYDQEAMKASLDESRIQYLFFGRELGGRPRGAEFYDAEGHVLYDRVAASPLFQAGLARLEKLLREFRVALLCGEENPAGCHRRLLIGRVLGLHGFDIQHIRGDGRLQPETDLLREETGGDSQLSLFEHDVIREWKSIPSVLPKKRQSSSSAG
jgi:hypothetical protein